MDLKNWFVIPLILLVASCAQKSVLSGGAKDTEGPNILESSPVNASKNFKGNQIELKFDEYLIVKDFKKNVLVSPPLNNIDYKLKGKKITLFWTDTLADSTTYSFFVGDAIRDLNEANPLKQNQFVFSTGDFIDSLSLKGSITKSEDGTPENGVLVFMYKSNNDSCIYEDSPDYVTKSDETGAFKFQYLAEGTYNIFALKDENTNYIYDEGNERLAFMDESINLTDSANIVKLVTFQQADTINKITSKKLEYAELLFLNFKQKVQDFEIELLGITGKKRAEAYQQWSLNRDSLRLWIHDFSGFDSIQVLLKEKNFEDTLTIFPNAKRSITEEVKLLWNYSNPRSHSKSDTFQLRFKNPIVSYDTAQWLLIKDSSKVDFAVGFDKVTNSFRIPVSKEGTYNLIIPSNNLTNLLGGSNLDTINVSFTVVPSQSLGNLKLNITQRDSVISFIQILNTKDLVLLQEQLTDQEQTIELTNLKPGKYKAVWVQEDIVNGEWDSGNYLKKRQAEKRVLFKEAIEIRANWDLDLEWNLTDQ